jgi:hypothetical protein
VWNLTEDTPSYLIVVSSEKTGKGCISLPFLDLALLQKLTLFEGESGEYPRNPGNIVPAEQ